MFENRKDFVFNENLCDHTIKEKRAHVVFSLTAHLHDVTHVRGTWFGHLMNLGLQ